MQGKSLKYLYALSGGLIGLALTLVNYFSIPLSLLGLFLMPMGEPGVAAIDLSPLIIAFVIIACLLLISPTFIGFFIGKRIEKRGYTKKKVAIAIIILFITVILAAASAYSVFTTD